MGAFVKSLILKSFFKTKTKFCTAIFVILFHVSCFGLDKNETPLKFVKVVENKNPFYLPFFPKQLEVKIPKTTVPLYSQTVSYLNNRDLRENVENNYKKEICAVDKKFFENTINTVILRELEFTDSFALYHGQKLEFLLFQDIFEILYEIFFEKALENYFILRAPSKDFKKFKNIQEILRPYIESGIAYKERLDDKDDFSKFTLCTNPSFFGNNQRRTSCTWTYFLSSCNKSYVDITNLVKDIFSIFYIEDLYNKYLSTIQTLNHYLSKPASGKTGILMQIFIPRLEIDEICYRSKPGGRIYHKGSTWIPASIDLINYKYNTSIFKDESTKTKDKTQFRLLVNEKMFPNGNIKMFRYYYETQKTKIYKNLLATLTQDLKKDIEQKFNFEKPKISF